ncbi:uncharacterized protein E0L32_000132 [Thyridium curvatum]|uniref:Xylanolytic transcriptional activator regulatory domain-containing protein n=1 Tax=Thyridium curvatum TaxID=1093900 RepID=A0A507BGG7_9PEZI|nr:uncharacterized protein E0L32_000132 [Thyridium curvatum]TPX15798.1 hypothetical protein E0L32_000132 [Thyridium curvatum]
MVSSSVQAILKTLNLPEMGPLQSVKCAANTPISAGPSDPTFLDEAGPSRDNSPKMSPEDERDLPRVPIQSVYHLTKLSSLRSLETGEEPSNQPTLDGAPSDLISQGLVSLDDAERLFHSYTTRLDHYMYGVGAKYSTLAALRRKSSILTAAILTVSAMHEFRSNNIYLICNREFRRLMTQSLFDRHIDRDHLRALCIASYWLNDSSWMLVGVASRRAATLDITAQFRRLQTENSEDAADYLRIWYLIYICDQHLSTLYGRLSETREDAAIQQYNVLLEARTGTVGDQRLCSQVALLTIHHNIRDLFGPDSDKPIPVVFLPQIKSFSRQIDQWLGHWSTLFPGQNLSLLRIGSRRKANTISITEVQEHFGHFPRKGALFHCHFAKLFLYSHVFRGLRDSAVPPPFLEAAHGAATAALSIINMILSDSDVRAALVGLPCYALSMVGFACMFLARLTSIHGNDLVDRSVVIDVLSQLTLVYRAAQVGKWHLVHHMANGLDRILGVLRQPPRHSNSNYSQMPRPGMTAAPDQTGMSFGFDDMSGHLDMSMLNPDVNLLMDHGMGLGVPQHIYFGGDGLGFDESPTGIL